MTQNSAQQRENQGGTWHLLLALALVRMAVSALVAWFGVVALSDDDYARVTIAQRTAQQFRFDPSGTSWLPFPFWAMAAIMRLLDPSLEVARLATVLFAVGATWLLYAAARAWGMSAQQAFVAAALATMLPVSALLGGVTVPEFPTAALSAFALLIVAAMPLAERSAVSKEQLERAREGGSVHMAAAHDGDGSAVGDAPAVIPMAAATGAAEENVAQDAAHAAHARSANRGTSSPRDATCRVPFLAACAAMTAATLSRYEAWPVAFVMAALVWQRLGGAPPARRAAASLVPVAGVLLWIVHNQLAHGDAISFVRRVASYRAALGPGEPGRDLWAGYLGGLVGGSPAILLGLGLVLVTVARSGDRSALRRELRRFVPWVWGAASLFAFLVLGAILGGGPTHHAERALLLVWLLAALALVDVASRHPIPRWIAIPVVVLLALDYRTQLTSRGINRRTEETIGHQLRSLVARGERVFAATPDYGYFAISAAFARPADVAFDSRDPRVKGATPLLEEPWKAVLRLESERARWLVAPTSVVLTLALRERSREGHLAIYELDAVR